MKCENCIHHAVCALYTYSGYASDECCFYETRPHGKWKYIGTGTVEKAKCSVCSKITITEPFGEPPFCPNCGADMREGDPDDRA